MAANCGHPVRIFLGDPGLIAAITKLNEHLDKGIPSYISYTHLQDELKKVGSIESDVSNQ